MHTSSDKFDRHKANSSVTLCDSPCPVRSDLRNEAVAGSTQNVVVVGLGEVGSPLLNLVSTRHTALGVDITRVEAMGNCDILHVCYPFQIADFVGETARYISHFRPALTIVNSTVAVGTTRTIFERTGAAVAYSPVRGKHIRMLEELKMYTKYIGAVDPEAGRLAAEHFESVGLLVRVLPSPEAAELAKLTETTYFGLLIAWAQEVERYCDKAGVVYDDVVSFYEEIKYLPPVKYFPGIIGGHCVMPNIELLSRFTPSSLLSAIHASNHTKIQRDGALAAASCNANP